MSGRIWLVHGMSWLWVRISGWPPQECLNNEDKANVGIRLTVHWCKPFKFASGVFEHVSRFNTLQYNLVTRCHALGRRKKLIRYWLLPSRSCLPHIQSTRNQPIQEANHLGNFPAQVCIRHVSCSMRWVALVVETEVELQRTSCNVRNFVFICVLYCTKQQIMC